ncbi:MAG: hypothetical protein ABIJ97_10635 [Bacteroidota bacterium]
MLNYNGRYTISYKDSISENNLQSILFSSGVWLNLNDTLLLQDTVCSEGNIKMKQYFFRIIDEYNLINLSSIYFTRNDTLTIAGYKDARQGWINNDQLIFKKQENETYNIYDLIKLKKGDIQQQAILNKFKNYCSPNDNISVEEFQNHYEITVSHPSEEDYTGGAEAFKVDKKTGESEMLWHEHPMKLPKIETHDDNVEK